MRFVLFSIETCLFQERVEHRFVRAVPFEAQIFASISVKNAKNELLPRIYDYAAREAFVDELIIKGGCVGKHFKHVL